LFATTPDDVLACQPTMHAALSDYASSFFFAFLSYLTILLFGHLSVILVMILAIFLSLLYD